MGLLDLTCLWKGPVQHWPYRQPTLPPLIHLQVIPDSDAHRAGLQEGDQVLSVNDVDFQDIEHSKVRAPLAAQMQGRRLLVEVQGTEKS